MLSSAPDPGPPGATAPPRLSGRDALGLLICLGAAILLVYRSALPGPFVSDDPLYYVHNPATSSLAPENLLAILDPLSGAHHYSYNYAPLHLLLVAAERQAFGSWMTGYHALGLLLHALSAVLFAALLVASGVPRTAAFLGGAIFALHPAQVEAVAWISQLKSTACMALALGSLLCLWRHPRVATALFGLALLTKFSAVAFLPAAAAFAWTRRAPRATWAWLAVWLGLIAAVGAAQWAAFGSGGAYELEVFQDRFEQLRTIFASGARYLWMAGSGLGLSAFHEPAPAGLASRFWWVGLACAAALAWRTVAALRRRDPEAGYWVLALASFLPVSQLVPFRFPLADRYLYFILPGLIGGSWLAATALCRALAERTGEEPARIAWRGGLAVAALLAVLFAFQARARVPLWLSDERLMLDAARHYPNGTHGAYLRAVGAARARDVERALDELRRAEELSRLSLVRDFEHDPWLAPIRNEPAFREFLRETARFRIDLVRRRGMRPGEEAVVALKYAALGEYDAATALVEDALREGSPRRAELLRLLETLRARRREAAADSAPR